MIGDRFIRQFIFPFDPSSIINETDIYRYVKKKFPSLSRKPIKLIINMRTGKKTYNGEILRQSANDALHHHNIGPKNPGQLWNHEDTFRVLKVNPSCEYFKYSKYFVGKLVRLVRAKSANGRYTGWYSFVYDEDRKQLNKVAGWSDSKKEYLLENPRLKHAKSNKE